MRPLDSIAFVDEGTHLYTQNWCFTVATLQIEVFKMYRGYEGKSNVFTRYDGDF